MPSGKIGKCLALVAKFLPRPPVKTLPLALYVCSRKWKDRFVVLGSKFCWFSLVFDRSVNFLTFFNWRKKAFRGRCNTYSYRLISTNEIFEETLISLHTVSVDGVLKLICDGPEARGVLISSLGAKCYPQEWTSSPGVKLSPRGCSVRPSVFFLNRREFSPLGAIEGVTIPPSHQSSPMGAKVHP
jgi:hypothetical protein